MSRPATSAASGVGAKVAAISRRSVLWTLPVAACAAIGAYILFQPMPSDPTPVIEVAGASPTTAPTPATRPATRGELAEEHLDVQEGVRPTGTPEEQLRADPNEEREWAASNRTLLISDSIERLEVAASRADEEGYPQRAQLMWRRIELLRDKLDDG